MILNVYANTQEINKKEMNQKFETSFYSESEKPLEEEKLRAWSDGCSKNPKLVKQPLDKLREKQESPSV